MTAIEGLHSGGSTARRLQRLPTGAWLSFAAVACVFLFHSLYSAVVGEASAAMAAAWALLLGAGLSTRWGRTALGGGQGLAVPACLFAVVVAVAGWSLTPWTPGGPHPVWSYVGIPGSSSIDPSATLLEILKLCGLGCAFLVGVIIASSDDRARLGLRLLVYSGALFGLAALLVFVAGHAGESQTGRFEAFFISPNTAGTVFGVLFLLAVAEVRSALRRSRPGERGGGAISQSVPPATAALVCAACLLASASRGALIATMVGLAVQLVWDLLSSKGKRKWVAAGAILAALVVLALLATAGELVLTRMLRLQTDASDRQAILAVHWRAFLASPLNGYGLGSFSALNKILLTGSDLPHLWSIRATHNVYLQWLEQAGLFGAVPMFLCLAWVIGRAIVGALRRRRLKGWLYALIAADLVFLIHGYSDFALETASVAAFWALLLGLQFGLARSSSERGGPTRGAPPPAALVLAFATLAFAALFVGALQGGVVGWAPAELRLAAGYRRASVHELQKPTPNLSAAERLTRAATTSNPFDTASWVQLAAVRSVRLGKLDPEGTRLLQTSYDLVGIDPEVALQRIRFCFEHWGELSPNLRREALAEADAVDPILHSRLRDALTSIVNAEGHLAAAFWLSQHS